MPRVPRFRDAGQLQGIPSARLSTDAPIEAFGGGEASGLREAEQLSGIVSGAGKAIFEIGMQEKQKADEIVAIDLDSKLARLETETQLAVRELRGRDAFSAPDVAEKMWRDGTKELEKLVSNRTQRAAFEQRKAQRFNSVFKHYQVHMADEGNKLYNETINSSIQTAKDSARLNAADPLAVSGQAQLVKERVQLRDLRNGIALSSDVHKANLRNELSELHRGVVDSRLDNGDYIGGKEYFTQAKKAKELNARDLDVLENSIRTATVQGEALTNATRIMLTEESSAKQLEKARALKDPEIAKATASEIRLRQAEQRQQDTEAAKALYDQASQFAEANAKRPPNSTWAQLTTTQKNSIDKRIDTIVNRKFQPGDGGETFYKLQRMASNPQTRDKFLRTDVQQEFNAGNLSFNERNELTRLQVKAQGKAEGFQEDIDGIQSKTGIVDSALKTIGFKLTAKEDKQQKEKIHRFRRLVDNELVLRQQSTGKKITNKDVQEVVDGLVRPIVTDRGLVPLPFAFGLGQDVEPAFQIELEEIPEATQQEIRTKLQQNGLEPSDDNVILVFIRTQETVE